MPQNPQKNAALAPPTLAAHHSVLPRDSKDQSTRLLFLSFYVGHRIPAMSHPLESNPHVQGIPSSHLSPHLPWLPAAPSSLLELSSSFELFLHRLLKPCGLSTEDSAPTPILSSGHFPITAQSLRPEEDRCSLAPHCPSPAFHLNSTTFEEGPSGYAMSSYPCFGPPQTAGKLTPSQQDSIPGSRLPAAHPRCESCDAAAEWLGAQPLQALTSPLLQRSWYSLCLPHSPHSHTPGLVTPPPTFQALHSQAIHSHLPATHPCPLFLPPTTLPQPSGLTASSLSMCQAQCPQLSQPEVPCPHVQHSPRPRPIPTLSS